MADDTTHPEPTYLGRALAHLPWRAASALAGAFARTPIPRPIRRPLLGLAARCLGADLSEAARPLPDYPHLAAFFARALAPGARPAGRTRPLWPCDGQLLAAGPIDDACATRLDVKGTAYDLAALTADPAARRALAGGSFASLYLAPADYHRVHAPVDGTLVRVRAVRGNRLPLHRPARRTWPDVHARNARLVFELTTPTGPAFVVMVGASNVRAIAASAEPGCAISAGGEIGRFELGSAVVALHGPGLPRWPARKSGSRVRCRASTAHEAES